MKNENNEIQTLSIETGFEKVVHGINIGIVITFIVGLFIKLSQMLLAI